MADELGFLAEQSVEAEETKTSPVADTTPVPEPIAAAEPASKAPERDAQGKFVAKVDSGPTPAAESAHIPISALLDEREKRQAAERRAAQAEGQNRPPTTPEPAQLEQYKMNLRFSRKFAEREYGKDTIETVHQWAFDKCAADPVFNQQMMSSGDPYEAAYQAFNREKVLAVVQPSDLDEFNAWRAAKEAAQTAPAAQPQQQAQPLPRSLVTAPGNGGAGAPHIPVGEGEAYARAFNP